MPTLSGMEEVLAADGSALKHIQVREYVRALVSRSQPGEPTPSERELVNRFGVARMTVRQAMDALVGEGLIERRPGRGTFVARPRRTPSQVTGFTEEMTRRGLMPDSQTLLARPEVAGPGVSRALMIGQGDSVYHWRRLRRADGVPMCLEDAYLSSALVPGFAPQETMPESLYAELDARGLRPTWAEDSITADLAGSDEADLLEVAPGSPVLRVARRAYVGDRAVCATRSVFRGDRFTLWVRLTNDC